MFTKNLPVSCSTLAVTQVMGSVTKSLAKVDIAGSTYRGTKNRSDEPAAMDKTAKKLVA